MSDRTRKFGNRAGHGRFSSTGVLAAVAPWIVIASLIYIALFTHPGTVGEVVVAPPISRIDNFYGVATASDGYVWLAGNVGKIVRSTDDGKHWIIQPTPTRANLQAIAAWNSSDVVAVGDQGTVMLTRDGGDTWADVPSVPKNKEFNKLLSVRILPDGAAWAVGEEGAVLQSTDHGTSWKRMRAPQDVTLHDIAGVGSQIWAVGEFGKIVTSQDDGATWSEESTGVDSTLNAVHFRDALHGVAVGLEGTILSTSDGGTTWTKASLQSIDEHLFAVSWNGQRWLVAGANGVIATAGADAGRWERARLPQANTHWHTSVVPVGADWLLVGSSVSLYSSVTNKWERVTSSTRRPSRE